MMMFLFATIIDQIGCWDYRNIILAHAKLLALS